MNSFRNRPLSGWLPGPVTRRDLLVGGASALALGGLGGRVARASEVSGQDLKFLFVFTSGGWDPTRVLAPEFDLSVSGVVDLEPEAGLATAGGISYVQHPDRPAVDAFFSGHHDRSVVFNGVMTQAIAHELCTLIAMTGESSGLASDWPSILGSAQAARYTLPHLVLGGPSFPGELGVVVARTGQSGQLDGLLDGSILDGSDLPVNSSDIRTEGLMDRYLLRRAEARSDAALSTGERSLVEAFEEALDQALDLKDLRHDIDLTAANLAGQLEVAVSALSIGMSRCVTMAFPDAYSSSSFDTHADNDEIQGPLWEQLFQGLGQLMSMLGDAPGQVGTSLADETVVVVLSEMGRTPLLNGLAGKDHWPYGSVLLVGPGLDGSRTIGGHDESFFGIPVDLATGELDDAGEVITNASVGATLLQLAGVDPAEYTDAEPVTGVLT
ncbi:MAG: DUF1501 domain-containing protein [Myxococcota bacterium]|nr:DUF1501 domain-containing protein [Myxococcota bacterium]